MTLKNNNDPIFVKALKIVKTPKSERNKKFNNIFKKLPKPQRDIVPLHSQKWFRALCDRLAKGERIYLGKARGLGLYSGEKVLCDHLWGCRHREVFHATDIPVGGSGHIPKHEYYTILWNNEKQIVVV